MVNSSRTRLRRRRRLRLKYFKKNKNVWKVMHTNIRGIDSKVESLATILNIIQPSVLTVNETFLENNRKIKLQGFSSFTSNRKHESGGGIATSVKMTDRMNAFTVT